MRGVYEDNDLPLKKNYFTLFLLDWHNTVVHTRKEKNYGNLLDINYKTYLFTKLAMT